MDTRNTNRSNESVDQRLSKVEDAIGDIQQRLDSLKTDMIKEMKALLTDRPTLPPIDLDNPNFQEQGESSTPPLVDPNHHRTLKVDMTRFDGHDPKGWLFKTERNFNYYNLTDEQRFMLVSVNMEGVALSWFQAMFDNNQLTTWPLFRQRLLHRFGPSPFHDLKGELMKLQQTSTVQDFYDRFEILVNQIPGMQPADLQSCFESGLRRDIGRDVRVLQPTSLDHAFHLAKMMEDRIADTSLPPYSNPSPYHPTNRTTPRPISYPLPSNQPPTNKPYTSPTTFPPLALPAPPLALQKPSTTPPSTYIPTLPRPPPNRPPSLPIRRLTPSQMDDRRQKGLCFNCNDRYFKGHVCENRLFMLVTSYEDDPDLGEPLEEPPTEDPVLLLENPDITYNGRDSNPGDYG